MPVGCVSWFLRPRNYNIRFYLKAHHRVSGNDSEACGYVCDRMNSTAASYFCIGEYLETGHTVKLQQKFCDTGLHRQTVSVRLVFY